MFVGTSGWQYAHWRGVFYPAGLRQVDWLGYYAQRFQTVEVNNTFYRLPEWETFAGWAERTPDDFVMAVKFSRFLTHMRRLTDPAEPVERFFDRAKKLGQKLGPVLLQLPPDLQADTGRLRDTLAQFPPGVRVAVEFRHPSWFTEQVQALLSEYGAALCWADRGSRLVTPAWWTTSWVFFRFHAGRGAPPTGYGRTALDSRARLLAERSDRDAYTYFNNDAHGCAVRDARRFALACRRHGLEATRVPEALPSMRP